MYHIIDKQVTQKLTPRLFDYPHYPQIIHSVENGHLTPEKTKRRRKKPRAAVKRTIYEMTRYYNRPRYNFQVKNHILFFLTMRALML